MATQLVESMATKWNPEDYHDEFRERLSDIIRKRIKQKGATAKVVDDDEPREDAATNVVDFVALLQKSLGNKQAPAGKSAKKAPAKAAAKKTAAKPRKAG